MPPPNLKAPCTETEGRERPVLGWSEGKDEGRGGGVIVPRAPSGPGGAGVAMRIRTLQYARLLGRACSSHGCRSQMVRFPGRVLTRALPGPQAGGMLGGLGARAPRPPRPARPAPAHSPAVENRTPHGGKLAAGPRGPAVGAAGAGAQPGRIRFPPFLKRAAESRDVPGPGASVVSSPRNSPRTPNPPLREGPRNCTREGLIHILGSRPGRSDVSRPAVAFPFFWRDPFTLAASDPLCPESCAPGSIRDAEAWRSRIREGEPQSGGTGAAGRRGPAALSSRRTRVQNPRSARATGEGSKGARPSRGRSTRSPAFHDPVTSSLSFTPEKAAGRGNCAAARAFPPALHPQPRVGLGRTGSVGPRVPAPRPGHGFSAREPRGTTQLSATGGGGARSLQQIIQSRHPNSRGWNYPPLLDEDAQLLHGDGTILSLLGGRRGRGDAFRPGEWGRFFLAHGWLRLRGARPPVPGACGARFPTDASSVPRSPPAPAHVAPSPRVFARVSLAVAGTGAGVNVGLEPTPGPEASRSLLVPSWGGRDGRSATASTCISNGHRSCWPCALFPEWGSNLSLVPGAAQHHCPEPWGPSGSTGFWSDKQMDSGARDPGPGPNLQELETLPTVLAPPMASSSGWDLHLPFCPGPLPPSSAEASRNTRAAPGSPQPQPFPQALRHIQSRLCLAHQRGLAAAVPSSAGSGDPLQLTHVVVCRPRLLQAVGLGLRLVATWVSIDRAAQNPSAGFPEHVTQDRPRVEADHPCTFLPTAPPGQPGPRPPDPRSTPTARTPRAVAGHPTPSCPARPGFSPLLQEAPPRPGTRPAAAPAGAAERDPGAPFWQSGDAAPSPSDPQSQ
ncbi:collagen alpha-1(I) chain-like [Cynocephalus volans]|uniref:collagen alpha-1(I) chain-like n=1 Tax=Cynocephalus volans TaxID=110931 RepID=UPI002FCBF880